MKNKVTCKACNGLGFVSVFSHDDEGACNGVSSRICDVCHSVGTVDAEMSEFDRVQQMNVDELALYLYYFAHGANKPLNVDEVKRHLLGPVIDGRLGFKRRAISCDNCRSFLAYEHMPDYKGIDFHKVEGAEGECFTRFQFSQDHQYAAVKKCDLCPEWKKRELQEGEKIG